MAMGNPEEALREEREGKVVHDFLTENVNGGSFWMINAHEMNYADANEFWGEHFIVLPLWYKHGHC